MENGAKPFESQRVAVGCIIAAIVGLNLWYDYYHPLGLIFDDHLDRSGSSLDSQSVSFGSPSQF